MLATIEGICNIVNGQVAQVYLDTAISSLCELTNGEEGGLSFISDAKYDKHIQTTKATAVLVRKDFPIDTYEGVIPILVDDPRGSFFRLLNKYYAVDYSEKEGIECPTHIEATAHISEKVFIGAFSYIGKNVSIGKSVTIYPQVYIGDDVQIGDYSVIYPGVKIMRKTQIGSHCKLYSNAILGSDGFGYYLLPNRAYQNITHIGNVVLGNHVDIGANTVIDCATIGSTIIEEGVKLDNLIHIAHNVKVGKHSAFAAQTGISGSAQIGEYCRLAGQVGVVGHIKIADGVTLLSKTGIADKNTKKNAMYMGTPALSRPLFLRAFTCFKKLPETMKKLEKLEKYIKEQNEN